MPDAPDEVAELRRRVARLEATQEIERLKYRYWRACDAKDVDGFRSCFVEDGAQIDYGPGLGSFDDREPLVQLYSAIALRRDDGGWMFREMHHGVHPDIEILDDSTATGKWTFGFMRINLVDHTIERASMEYDDIYVVEAGEWKIQTSSVTPLAGLTIPIPDGARIAPGPKVAAS